MSYNRGKNFHKNRFKKVTKTKDFTERKDFGVGARWANTPLTKEEKEKQRKVEQDNNKWKAHKEFIVDILEKTPLNEVKFDQLYKLPFRSSGISHWIYDQDSNFVFQFEADDREYRKELLSIINGEMEPKHEDVRFYQGEIYIGDESVIMIRGWGNLTGIGGYNLSGEIAGRIQDTLGEYLVKKLTKR